MKSPLFLLAPLLPAATYWVGCAAYTRMTGDPLGIGLGWNLILAALPLLFGRLALRCRSQGLCRILVDLLAAVSAQRLLFSSPIYCTLRPAWNGWARKPVKPW